MEKNDIGPLGQLCTVHIEKLLGKNEDDNDVYWKLTSTTAAGRKGEILFKLDGDGVYDEHTWDGRKCKTRVSWNDGILFQQRKCAAELPDNVVTRTFRGDEMEVIATADYVSSHRLYKRFEGPCSSSSSSSSSSMKA